MAEIINYSQSLCNYVTNAALKRGQFSPTTGIIYDAIWYFPFFPAFIPARYILSVLGSIAMAIIYGLKVNLSVAMVAMVNHTAVSKSSHDHDGPSLSNITREECEAEVRNTTGAGSQVSNRMLHFSRSRLCAIILELTSPPITRTSNDRRAQLMTKDLFAFRRLPK